MNTLEEEFGSLVRKLSPTEKYRLENEYVLSLERAVLDGKKQKKIIGWSLRRLLKHHIASAINCSIRLPLEYVTLGSGIFKSARLRGTKGDSQALVIGNGPSQGFICAEQLNRFISKGGETVVLNYWFLNKDLAGHSPTWAIFSDPKTFHFSEELRDSLCENLSRSKSTRVLAPASLKKDIRDSKVPGLLERTAFFIDTELSMSRNISPLFPRGYISMTLYKALAWAVFLEYRKIGVIGMDNTYPRNIYNDADNRLLRLELHAQTQDKVFDQSLLYDGGVAAALDRLTRLFFDLQKFPTDKIFNLDPYSLTDRFQKIEISSFFNEQTES